MKELYICTKDIKNFDLCPSRLENYLKYYNDFEGTLKEFILLEKINISDIVWTLTKSNVLNKKELVLLSIYFAFDVLKIYENIYPDDNRPRKAIEAAQTYLDIKSCNAIYIYDAASDAIESVKQAAIDGIHIAYAAAYSAFYAAYTAYTAVSADDINAAAYVDYAGFYADFAINAEYTNQLKQKEQIINLIYGEN